MDLKKSRGGDSYHALSAPIYRGHVYSDENVLKHNDIYKRTVRKAKEALDKLAKLEKEIKLKSKKLNKIKNNSKKK